MTIRFYRQSQGSGFVGYRVSGTYAGKDRHAEFPVYPSSRESDPLVRYQKLKAELQLAEWEAEDALYQYRLFVTEDDPKAKPYQGTGCHGIFCDFFQTKWGIWQAGFRVRRMSGRGTRFLFDVKPFSRAWRDAVGLWASMHEIEPEDVQRLLKHPPEPAQFKELRRYLNSQEGKDIPVEALSPVFAEQRQELAQLKLFEKAESLKLTEGLSAPATQQMEADMMAWFESEKG